MTSVLKIGQSLKGISGTYTLTRKIFKDGIWAGLSQNQKTVIAKTGPKLRLAKEQEVLEHFHCVPYLRHLVDVVEQPPLLILEHVAENLLVASNRKALEHADIKFVARNILEVLKVLHRDGYVHTAVLADFGDAVQVDLKTEPKDMAKEDGHIIGAAIFRSPEAMLNLKWGTATDIWSFGATLISLIWGKNWHIFKPDEVTIDDENYAAYVLIKQADHFGPFPKSYVEIADEERLATLTIVNNYSSECGTRKPFELAEDAELAEGDREFIYRIMKLDPRDRPTADQLLQDKWFRT